MNFELIVFDLDGTLTASHKTIYRATLRTLEELDIDCKVSEKKFYNMIGHHFEDIFSRMNIPVKDFDEFIKIYKSVYFDYIDQTELYPGVKGILPLIKEKKFKTALLTTKSQEHAEKIIDYFNLGEYFDIIMGRRSGIAHKPSAEPLNLICSELKVDPAKTLMVGDSELDIICGKNAGTKTCVLTYGYRTKEHLLKEKPDFIFDSIDELESLIQFGRMF